MRVLQTTPEALADLSRADPVLAQWIEMVGPLQRPLYEDLFMGMAHSVVAQQISTQAADTVWRRLCACLPEITPQGFLALEEEALRACGLSARKISYLQEIAASVLRGDVDFERLRSASNEEAVEILCKMRGIGPWTAEMLLIFAFGRRDVFSAGDLGLRHGLCRLYGLQVASPSLLEGARQRFAPWQSLASLYLWALAAEPEKEGATHMARRYVDSPLGPLTVCASPKGISAIDFADDEVPLPERHPRHPLLLLAAHELEAYFAGRLKTFTLPLDEGAGTPFQRLVWRCNREIPYGDTCSYGELAQKIGRPTAARAVAGALHRNPLSMVTPCHRVIGADGGLTGYGGGLWRKRALLQLERGEGLG